MLHTNLAQQEWSLQLKSMGRGVVVLLAFPSQPKPTPATNVKLLFPHFIALTLGHVWPRWWRRQHKSCKSTWKQHQELPLTLSALLTGESLWIELKMTVFKSILVSKKHSFIFNFLSGMKGDQIQIATMKSEPESPGACWYCNRLQSCK